MLFEGAFGARIKREGFGKPAGKLEIAGNARQRGDQNLGHRANQIRTSRVP